MARVVARINGQWETSSSTGFTWEQVNTEVLMDIRDELQKLNRLLACPNFLSIPQKLERISRNTTRPRKHK